MLNLSISSSEKQILLACLFLTFSLAQMKKKNNYDREGAKWNLKYTKLHFII